MANALQRGEKTRPRPSTTFKPMGPSSAGELGVSTSPRGDLPPELHAANPLALTEEERVAAKKFLKNFDVNLEEHKHPAQDPLKTALREAAFDGRVGVIKLLMASGIDLKGEVNGLILKAASRAQVDFIKFLSQHFDINDLTKVSVSSGGTSFDINWAIREFTPEEQEGIRDQLGLSSKQ